MERLNRVQKFLMRYSQVVVGGGLLAGVIGYSTLRPYYIDYMRWSSSQFVEGEEMLPSKDLYNLYTEVAQASGISKDCLSQIGLFMTVNNEALHLGSRHASSESLFLGLPFYFNYSSLSDLPTDMLQFGRKRLPVSWNSLQGRTLQEALKLPDDCKRFIIARELFYLDTWGDAIVAGSAAVTGYISYLTCYCVNRATLLPVRTKLYTRVLFYTLVGLAGYLMHCQVASFYKTKVDLGVDKKAAMLGRNYMTAGILYYERVVARNCVFRELLDTMGAKYFSRLGNEKYSILTSSGCETHTRLAALKALELYGQSGSKSESQ